jgi:predicted RNase H-like nuclease
MTREVLIGFDSAWTDSSKNPGAATAYVIEGGQRPTFYPPRLTTFGDALELIGEWTAEADYVLIAIDQPTVVPNNDGARPVDRVASSLISTLGGGVQPARKGGMGARMFGEGAAIWSFLDAVGAIQNPINARDAAAGRFLMEVFPALALPAMVPAIWQRRQAAKYNPVAKKFDPNDWRMVASGVATFVRGLDAGALADWAEEQASRDAPRKADQDRLDAAICLAIALAWRRGPCVDTLQIGDERAGYMATIVSAQTRAVLVKAAAERDVAVDQVWEVSAASVAAMPVPSQRPFTRPGSPTPHQVRREMPGATPPGKRPTSVDPMTLRALLVDRARSGIPITYGEAAAALGHRWNQGVGASLTRALDTLIAENKKAGEPLLSCLVVNKVTRLPGKGFNETSGHGKTEAAMQRKLFDKELNRCRQWPWR